MHILYTVHHFYTLYLYIFIQWRSLPRLLFARETQTGTPVLCAPGCLTLSEPFPSPAGRGLRFMRCTVTTVALLVLESGIGSAVVLQAAGFDDPADQIWNWLIRSSSIIR